MSSGYPCGVSRIALGAALMRIRFPARVVRNCATFYAGAQYAILRYYARSGLPLGFVTVVPFSCLHRSAVHEIAPDSVEPPQKICLPTRNASSKNIGKIEWPLYDRNLKTQALATQSDFLR
ncbi:hypothetical protein RB195_005944 [Necator americanus]|uniref:Uncharacterized protein n=1 Tax=Necator americanus TaxID=51031 RepID=A0ABR1BTB8_NECAM